MGEKKTLKERRAESDGKIIQSAIRNFSKTGYTNTSLSDIAKDAGVTAGLISQRYESKEHLLMVAFDFLTEKYFPDFPEDLSTTGALIEIVNRIRYLYEADVEAFDFCWMIYSSMDTPSSVFTDYRTMWEKSNACKIFSKAQKEGVIPSGNIEYMLLSFSSMVFHFISICKRYGTEIPGPEFFLSIIPVSDEENKKQLIKLKEQMISIFCKDFEAVWLVKPDDLSMEIYYSDMLRAIPNSVDTAISLKSYEDARLWYVENYVVEQSKEKVRSQSEIGNVLEELKNDGTFHIEYGRSMNGLVNYNQLYYDKIIHPVTKKIEYILLGFRDVDVATKADIDDLTGVLSRSAFFRQAEKLLLDYPEEQFDIVLSDIVDFKKINETYGSGVADQILKWHGGYLSNLANENMIVGRYGGDQMVLFGRHAYIEECLSPKYIELFHDAELNNDLPSINFKYGIYADIKHGNSILSACDKAHMALNSIKHHYSKEVAYYDISIKMQVEKQRKIEESMYESMINGDFKVYYQPKHDPKTGKLVGAEALIRWIHPKYGFMSPGDFIPLFEQNGFVAEIDRFVGSRTCENLRKWMNKGIKTVPISVNISRLTLSREELVDEIQSSITTYQLDPGQLHLEITETLMGENAEEMTTRINALRTLGCKVELDDFGSGYSSLNILSTFPIDILKLDMSFLQQFGDAKRTIVLESCIDMAKKLGFETVSEGVELGEQRELLEQLGVDMIQGYFYSKPLPEADFEHYLEIHSK